MTKKVGNEHRNVQKSCGILIDRARYLFSYVIIVVSSLRLRHFEGSLDGDWRWASSRECLTEMGLTYES